MFNIVLSSGIVGVGLIDPNGASVQVVGLAVVVLEVDSFVPVVEFEIRAYVENYISRVTCSKCACKMMTFGQSQPFKSHSLTIAYST